ncbi:MAG: hypothetical protein ACOYO2_05785, partial [Mycobacterium sp.]
MTGPAFGADRGLPGLSLEDLLVGVAPPWARALAALLALPALASLSLVAFNAVFWTRGRALPDGGLAAPGGLSGLAAPGGL